MEFVITILQFVGVVVLILLVLAIGMQVVARSRAANTRRENDEYARLAPAQDSADTETARSANES